MYKKGGHHLQLSCGSRNVGAAGKFVRLIFVILNIQVHTLRVVMMISEVFKVMQKCPI